MATPAKTKSEILQDMKDTITSTDETIDVSSGSILEDLLNPVSEEGRSLYEEVADIEEKQSIANYANLTSEEVEDLATNWGIERSGIQVVLKRLHEATGITCNPHSFRRAFACLLRKAGVDTMTIKDLGRWESIEMVQRYTRSVTFEDSMKFYRSPLG